MAASQTRGRLASILLPPSPGTSGIVWWTKGVQGWGLNRTPQQAWLLVPWHP